MKKNYFVGIDVSKQTVDVAFIIRHDQHTTPPCWKVFDNNEHGLYEMKTWLRSSYVPFNEHTLLMTI
jgi:hypothetical protein